MLLMLVARLERDELSRGLATLCVGVGQGMALAVERV
jgi:acetyl-CoA acetyltransferase